MMIPFYWITLFLCIKLQCKWQLNGEKDQHVAHRSGVHLYVDPTPWIIGIFSGCDLTVTPLVSRCAFGTTDNRAHYTSSDCSRVKVRPFPWSEHVGMQNTH